MIAENDSITFGGVFGNELLAVNFADTNAAGFGRKSLCQRLPDNAPI
jgi:hypothetical protein